jgi:glycerol-3-phosphate dehydrogenase (NAD(P)+)
VVFATPSHALAETARTVAPHISDTCAAVVTVTKGIDPGTTERLSVVLGRAIPRLPVVVLAGPGIPYDYALGDPTSLVAASEDTAAAELVRDSLSASNLRIYSSGDVVGVELGAALKNVFAIAAGIADGLKLGLNAKAALLTRGLAEMIRLGLAMNANPLTFAGLSGMGDLIVTAFSDKSRNHNLGLFLAQGLDLRSASAKLNGVAEGALTCRTARSLASRHRIEMPITEEVDAILYENADPQRSLRRLLGRSPKPENIE